MSCSIFVFYNRKLDGLVMKPIKISIITPNYNYAQYIGKTIESVVMQDYDNIEHIIVDDGSTDNSVDIIKGYQEKYPNKIKLIQQENKGQTKALNAALSNVTGDIIGWINSDDTFCKCIFSQIVNLFLEQPSLDAIFGDINIIDKNNNLIRTNKYLKFNYLSAVFNGFGKEIPSNAIFWKKYLSDSIDGFDESYDYGMDAEYWSRLLVNKNVKKINLIIANFRWHQSAKTIKSKNIIHTGHTRAIREKNLIMEKSYENIRMSKLIPFEYSKPIYYVFKFRRLILRGLMGEYFKRNKL